MDRHVEILGHQVHITEGPTPVDTRLSIDGKEIPLVYNSAFYGWGVSHTIYGFYHELERLARHIVVSSPYLIIAHGNGHGGEHSH